MGNRRDTFQQVVDEISSLTGRAVTVSRGEEILASSLGEPVRAADPVLVPWTFNGDTLLVAVHQPEPPLSESLVAGLVRLIIQQLTVTNTVSDWARSKDRFITDLLCGPVPEHYDITRLSDVLGIDIARPRSVLLIDASGYTQGPPGDSAARAHRVIGAIASFFCIANETICGYLGSGEIAVLKATTSQDLRRWSRVAADSASPTWADLDALKFAAAELRMYLEREFVSEFAVAVGRYHPGVAGLRSSYDDCKLALQLGRFGRSQGVHCLDQLGITALVGVPDQKMKLGLAERLLAPLSDPDLVETLLTFFDCDCAASDTARVLNIHRNTLSYRLDKVALLTGLNPRVFGDAIQLRAALEIRRLSAPAA